MDKSFVESSAPPSFDLTEEARKAIVKAADGVATVLNVLSDDLLKEGLEPDQIFSACSHVSLDHASLSAVMSAISDNREPNRDWFTQNAGDRFDAFLQSLSQPCYFHLFRCHCCLHSYFCVECQGAAITFNSSISKSLFMSATNKITKHRVVFFSYVISRIAIIQQSVKRTRHLLPCEGCVRKGAIVRPMRSIVIHLHSFKC